MTPPEIADPEVEEVAWDLAPLLDGAGEDAVDAMLAEAQRRADAFAEAHAGRVAELDGPGLDAAMNELAELQELDRKSTRLNSSHANISYAVFCLKKQSILHDVEHRD